MKDNSILALLGLTALSALAVGIACWLKAKTQIATGQYVGNGEVEQPIEVGFRPRYVRVWQHLMVHDALLRAYEKLDQFGEFSIEESNSLFRARINCIVGIYDRGFVVSDGNADYAPNTDGEIYDYLCIE